MAFVLFRTFTILAAILASSGCNQSASDQSSQAQPDKQTGAGKAGPGLEGAWQVAEVDGRTLVGVTLKGANGALFWEPGCAGWFIKYRQDGATIRFKSKSSPAKMRVVCAIGYPKSLPSIFRALPALDRIEFLNTGSVRLTGAGHVIRLERLLSPAKRPIQSLAGRWSVSTLDGRRLPKGSLVFSATRDVITWQPSCAGQTRSYVIENNRIAIGRMPDTPPPPPPLDAPVARLICTIGLPPELMSAFSAMEKVTHVRPASAGGITMTGNGHQIVLIPAADI